MLYPLYVWKDENSAYGASFPDMPGVYTAADELSDLPAMAQEAVETMYEHASDVAPPTSIEHWSGADDYTGGLWMMVDINLDAIGSGHVMSDS